MGVYERPAPLDYTDLVFGEKTVMGSMGGHGVFEQAIQIMAEGKFDGEALITAHISLNDIVAAGLEALVKSKDQYAKILVSPT